MSEDIKPCFKQHISIARILLGLSVLIILATVIVSVFSLEQYRSICICTINYLAYSWIAFAIAIVVSLLSLICAAQAALKSECCSRYFLANIFLWLQFFAFVAGIVFLLIFVTRYTDVIG